MKCTNSFFVKILKSSIILGTFILLTSCADSKTFNIDGKDVVVEPYGWANSSNKNDSIVYDVSVGNIVWDVLLSETIIVPVILTADQFYEPVRKKRKNE